MGWYLVLTLTHGRAGPRSENGDEQPFFSEIMLHVVVILFRGPTNIHHYFNRAEDLSRIHRGIGPVRWTIPRANCIGLHHSEGHPLQGFSRFSVACISALVRAGFAIYYLIMIPLSRVNSFETTREPDQCSMAHGHSITVLHFTQRDTLVEVTQNEYMTSHLKV